MPKAPSPAAALGRLPKTELVRTYVWEAPVRVAHWLIFFSFLSLAFTGLYMHRPFLLAAGRASFLMAEMRFVHVVSGFVLIGAFALRVYWFFKGNFWSRWSAYLPIRGEQWEGMGSMLEFYLFMRFDPGHRVGHNPLAALTYLVIYVLILVEIVTGLVLYDRVLGNPVFHQFIGWLPGLVDPSYLRLVHYFLTFVFFAFVIFHVYASVLVSVEEENGLLDSIFSGWKFVPAGELRREVASIPEARSFARRHQLLPRASAQQRPGAAPGPHPGPGPVTLYRNWISYAGTGVAAVGVLVFAVLTAYHTIGGGALVQPYGDLVIFLVPPIFVLVGVAVVLIGIYVEWLRWRMRKPLSFARYPKWDLNVASERKALLVVGIGAATLSVPALYGSYQAYRYTDAVPFCGAVCHSMTPEYVTYQRSPHAHVGCADCHIRAGATGYVEAKARGMLELLATIRDDYPRPIPVPLTALRPIRTKCVECHWPGHLLEGREVRRVHFLSDERNTPWEIDLLVRIGGGEPAGASRMGAHWHVASKVEYVASDAARQDITWVRAVDAETGAGTVYTSSPPSESAVAPAGDLHVMDCIDCHSRPSHALQPPDRSVNGALADGRIDPSLPFIKQQAVAALTATYATQDEAMQGIEHAVLGYYRREHPAVYAARRDTITRSIAVLQESYRQNVFPSMKVRWDTYYVNDGHLRFPGCFRCHDGNHKSLDGSVIRAGCNDCHDILRQGMPGSMQTATGREGLAFQHPVDIGDLWVSQPCSSCHTGGAP